MTLHAWIAHPAGIGLCSGPVLTARLRAAKSLAPPLWQWARVLTKSSTLPPDQPIAIFLTATRTQVTAVRVSPTAGVLLGTATVAALLPQRQGRAVLMAALRAGDSAAGQRLTEALRRLLRAQGLVDSRLLLTPATLSHDPQRVAS